MDIRSYLLLLLAFNSTFAQVESSPISILQSPVKLLDLTLNTFHKHIQIFIILLDWLPLLPLIFCWLTFVVLFVSHKSWNIDNIEILMHVFQCIKDKEFKYFSEFLVSYTKHNNNNIQDLDLLKHIGEYF